MAVHIRNNTLVEAEVNGKVTAKAYKSDPRSGTWFLGKFINERWWVVGTLTQPMTEAEQRKALRAVLEIIQ